MAEMASKGAANTGLGLGIAGTALGLLNGGLGGILGGANAENMAVNRYELRLNQEIAAKDAEIGLLKADKYTDMKISDTYAVLEKRIREVEDAQNKMNLEQAVYNGTNTAAMSCMQSQIAQLMALTKLVVPNGSVCPGWGNVTVAPATT